MSDRVTHRRGQAALVGDVDVAQAADRLRDYVLGLRNWPGKPRPVNFDDERPVLNVEGKTASITDLSVPAGKNACRNVFDSKLFVCGMPVNDDGHIVTIPLQHDRMWATWPYWMRNRSLKFELHVRHAKVDYCCHGIAA